MNIDKVFEALSRTKSEIIDGFPTGNLWVGMTPEELEAIKRALTELETIKNVKPSEALEEVKQIKFYVGTIIGLEFVKGDDVFSEAKKQDYEIFKIKCGKIEQALINFNSIMKQINDVSGKSALGLLNKIKDKLDTYAYNNILEALLKTQSLERENDELAKYKKAWEIVKEHLTFEERGIETYANKTKYIVRIESKDTGATIHIHLDTQEEADLLKEMSK